MSATGGVDNNVVGPLLQHVIEISIVFAKKIKKQKKNQKHKNNASAIGRLPQLLPGGNQRKPSKPRRKPEGGG